MPGFICTFLFSILLLPINFCCAFWLFREALNLTGMTFQSFLKRNSHTVLPGRPGVRQRFLLRFFSEHSSDPKTSGRLLWAFGICTLPGLGALLLAEYTALHPDQLKYALAGDLILLTLNIGIALAGRAYRRKHPLDEQMAERLEAQRAKEKEEGKKTLAKSLLVYGIVGAFFLAVLSFFFLGIASIGTQRKTAQPEQISLQDVNTVLVNKGYETANIPTTYWFYDESKLVNVCAGVKGENKFEFYEYTDGETVDGVYDRILASISQDMEPAERESHETTLPGGCKMFTAILNGIYQLVLYQNDTVVYAHSPDSFDEINDILMELGYLQNG